MKQAAITAFSIWMMATALPAANKSTYDENPSFQVSEVVSPESAVTPEQKHEARVQTPKAKFEKALAIEKNKAVALDLNEGVTEVFVANPDIADVQLNNQRIAYIYGKKPGVTSIFASNQSGVILSVSLTVVHNLDQLKNLIKLTYPEERVEVKSSPHGILLTGSISSAKVSADIEKMASSFLDEKEKITNQMTVSNVNQVMLKVKIAEVSRNVLNKFDMNWSAVVSNANRFFSYGVLTNRAPIVSGAFSRSSSGSETPFGSYAGRFNDGTTDLATLMDILDSEGLASVLAEPTLVALSGESASFLVGGEFPYPVPQDNNTITIEFKQFGINLTYVPTVLNGNMINIRMRTEVSELDRGNPLEFPVGGTVARIPPIKSRKAETSVEMSSGQSLVIAGLLSHDVTNNLRELPGLAEVPILGALFRSTEFRERQTELVIIVTPYLVKAGDNEKSFKTPIEGLKHAAPLEMILLRNLNQTYPYAGALPQKMMGHAGFHTE